MAALRMRWRWQVGFTYPGASKQQLSDVNVRVALSSRIAVLGANGAGKARTLCCSVLRYDQCHLQLFPTFLKHYSRPKGLDACQAPWSLLLLTSHRDCVLCFKICPGLTQGFVAHSPRSSSC